MFEFIYLKNPNYYIFAGESHNNLPTYKNVTVNINSTIFPSAVKENLTQNECDYKCRNRFRCVGYIYYPLTQECHQLKDAVSRLTFELEHVITFQNDAFNEFNDVYFKPSNTCKYNVELDNFNFFIFNLISYGE